ARLINHSCSANCNFFEVQNRRFATAVVVSIEKIGPGSEITVDYAADLISVSLAG
ncbi:hypothetical protein JG687_00014320, partial [Phytophthora cactorum]